MNRIAITNGEGKWFDADKAKLFKEESYHNGSNFISKATDDQFTHEYLYLTKSGHWVLNRTSDYQGSVETYEIITEDEAVVWFLKQSMDLPEELKGKDVDYEI